MKIISMRDIYFDEAKRDVSGYYALQATKQYCFDTKTKGKIK